MVTNIPVHIKKLWPLVLLYPVFLLGSCSPKSNLTATAFKYNISGKIAGSKDGDTVLLGVLGNPKRINTAYIKNEKFKFTGKIPEVSMGVIQYKYSFNITEGSAFVIEKGPIVVQAQLKSDDKDIVTGKIIKSGKQNAYLNDLKSRQAPYLNQMNEAFTQMQLAQKENKPEEVKLYREKNLQADQDMQSVRERFIKEHPDAIAALYAYSNSINFKTNPLDKTLAILNAFGDQIKKTSFWLKVKNLAETEAQHKN